MLTRFLADRMSFAFAIAFFSGPTARTASGCSHRDGSRAVRGPPGALVVRLAVGKHLAPHHARFDQRVERAVDGGDADAMAVGGAAMDLAHARMIVRCPQHLENDAPMLGEPQAALHAE